MTDGETEGRQIDRSWIDGWTDRDKWMARYRHTDSRWTNREIQKRDVQTNGKKEGQVFVKKDGCTNIQLDGWMAGQAERQMDGQTEEQTNRDTVELKYVQID